MSPDGRLANLGLLRDHEMQRVRDRFVRTGEYGLSSAVVHSLDGHVVILALDLREEDQRSAIQRACLEHKAWYVQHVMEVWVASAHLDSPADLEAMAAAKAAETIHRLPGRTEKLVYAEESVATPIRIWGSEITRDASGKPTLGEWEEATVRLPWPGWKRYLPADFSGASASRRGASHAQ